MNQPSIIGVVEGYNLEYSTNVFSQACFSSADLKVRIDRGDGWSLHIEGKFLTCTAQYRKEYQPYWCYGIEGCM
jgi:hypothetical protein